jgi:hypothetical protein
MEIIKDALDQQFDYLNYLLVYKFVKDQVVIVLKSRLGWLKKKIEKGVKMGENLLSVNHFCSKKVMYNKYYTMQ